MLGRFYCVKSDIAYREKRHVDVVHQKKCKRKIPNQQFFNKNVNKVCGKVFSAEEHYNTYNKERYIKNHPIAKIV